MHAGMFDVQKIIKIVKLWTDKLQENTCWIEVDYRIDDNDIYTSFETIFKSSPEAEIDLSPIFGMAGKRLQFRIRFYTQDATQTPILLATNIEAVMRISIKNIYSLTFRLVDDDTTMDQNNDDTPDVWEKLSVLDAWADDRSNSMLRMHSIDALWDDKLIFLNPLSVTVLHVKNPENSATRNRLICTTTVQDA